MKTIPLTRGKVALVDDRDFARVSKLKWYAKPSRQTWYAVRNVRVNGKRMTVGMHRFILESRLAASKMPDHRDGNGLNNQRYNLRIVTRRRNARNQRKQTGRATSSKYKGVHWHRASGAWTASICVQGNSIHLGTFHGANGEQAAALAYNDAAAYHFGKHACLNEVHTP
jgi:hypothetical protein